MDKKTINIMFFSNEKNKLFSLYKIRKLFQRELATKNTFYTFDKEGNVNFHFNKYSSLHIWNIDMCECLLDIIKIINRVNAKHKIICYSDYPITKKAFKLFDDNLDASIMIKGYMK